MPKIKMPRSTPSIDMTPMVDLGFLLVTFFMLTTQFRPDEPVEASTPKSVSELILPDKDMMLLTIDKDNRVFYTFDNQQVRKNVLAQMGEKYGVKFSEEQTNTFSNLTSVGVKMAQLPAYLDMESSARRNFKTNGIPMDSLHNELYDWLYFTRMDEKNLTKPYRVAVKGDRDAEYKTVKRVIKVLEEVKVFKFNLITDMKTE